MPEGEASVGRFSLFCENRLIPVLTLCYKNLIGSHIYIYMCVCVCVCVCVCFFGLMRTDHVLRIFIFSKFTRFSNRAVFAYMVTVILLTGSLFLEIDI